MVIEVPSNFYKGVLARAPNPRDGMIENMRCSF